MTLTLVNGSMIPDTKISLIMRLNQTNDSEAWSEFVAAYQPVILWVARRQGLQQADAEDIAQQVLASIARALKQRPHNPDQAKFRTWLYRVTHNAILNLIRRQQKPDRAIGGDTVNEWLVGAIAPGEYRDEYDKEYERAVFRWAAERVRREFQPQTWDAFWLNMVKGDTAEIVATKISEKYSRSFSAGSVYAAKSRVLKRIREKVEEFDDSCQIG